MFTLKIVYSAFFIGDITKVNVQNVVKKLVKRSHRFVVESLIKPKMKRYFLGGSLGS